MYSDLNYFLPSLLVSLTTLRNYNNVYRLENVYTLVVCARSLSLCVFVYITQLYLEITYYNVNAFLYIYIINSHILHIPLFKCFPNFFRVVESIQIQNFISHDPSKNFSYAVINTCIYVFDIFIIYENIKKTFGLYINLSFWRPKKGYVLLRYSNHPTNFLLFLLLLLSFFCFYHQHNI